MIFAFGVVFGVQDTFAQKKGKVVYTQGAMTGTATLKGTLWKTKWIYFEFNFPNGKPAFNTVLMQNMSKFTYEMTKPDGSIVTDISQPISDTGKYKIKVKLQSPWSNSNVKRSFKMVFTLE